MATGTEKWRQERGFEMWTRKQAGDTVKMLAHDYGLTVGSIYRILKQYRMSRVLKGKKPRGR